MSELLSVKTRPIDHPYHCVPDANALEMAGGLLPSLAFVPSHVMGGAAQARGGGSIPLVSSLPLHGMSAISMAHLAPHHFQLYQQDAAAREEALHPPLGPAAAGSPRLQHQAGSSAAAEQHRHHNSDSMSFSNVLVDDGRLSGLWMGCWWVGAGLRGLESSCIMCITRTVLSCGLVLLLVGRRSDG